ncbi:hypothetical protein C5167_032622 [Papaver somniferum]|uniref:Peptidase metallopeptidase domain-containing protein n=1 Tax=Papaver somniferum TaxID=3469 RepID=A0A4Y7K8W9_PAPSO|nr:metalloendoproteinase 1-like [Papaver somniferum]RZC68772.1 hypothetical protein C5167_032622 [Papaver somniferum]
MNNAKPVVSIQHVPFFLVFLLAISPLSTLCEGEITQGFDFLQHLQGCHKGQTVAGLHEVKTYLKKFGYGTAQDDLSEHARDDDFDEVLESQIRTYQLNYHLDPTGTLDAQTVRQMMTPRCGCKDTIRGAIPARSWNGKHSTDGGQRSRIDLNVSDFTFFPGAPRWSKTELTYGYSSSASDIDAGTFTDVVESALAKWAAVSGFSFEEASSTDSDVVLGVHRYEHGDGAPFDGKGGVLAHAFAPSIGWCHFDADENWSTNPGPREFDLETATIHEMGHVLGLGHSYEPNAIMYPYIPPGTEKRDLHENDIQGIQALYSLST